MATTQKTLLVVNHDRTKLKTNSSVLATFNRHDLFAEEPDVLSWVQQHQPDLIILNLEWAQLVKRQLIAALRLDWLTNGQSRLRRCPKGIPQAYTAESRQAGSR